MRRKIIPENAIPDRYSEVVRTFGGASEEYEERLAAYTQSLGKFDKLAERLGIGKDVVDALAGCANAVCISLEAYGVNIDATQATDLLKLSQACISGTLDVSQQIAKKGGITADNITGIAKTVLGAVTASITEGFSKYTSSDQALGKAINSGLQLGLSGLSFGVKVKQGKYQEALSDVGDVVAGCCAVYSSDRTSKGDTETATVNTQQLGTFIAAGFKTGPAVADFIKTCVEESKKDEADLKKIGLKLLAVVENGMQNTISASSSWYLVQRDNKLEKPDKTDAGHVTADQTAVDKDKSDGASSTQLSTDEQTLATDQDHAEKLAFNKNVIETEWSNMQVSGAAAPGYLAGDKTLALMQSLTPKQLEEKYKDDPQMKALAALIKKQQAAVVEDSNENLEQKIAQEAKDFRDLLNRSETGDSELDVQAIETLILQLKKDQMIVDFVTQIVKMPAQAIAAFLPQAGIAVTAVDLLTNIRKAIEHYIAFAEWNDNRNDASAAMSVQVEAMANRAGLSFAQGTEQVVQMLENGAKLVAQCLSVAGPAAPYGHAAAVIINAEQSIRQVLKKLYTIGVLKKAWNVYREALDNPQDRKLARQAIRDNPTLAKYAIAYGAEYENNPVARNAMQKCGLSAEVLDNPKTNVQKVVAYLEALYPEDPVLLNETAKPEKWYPGPVQFTAASVAAFFAAAEKTQKLKPGQGRGLVNDFVESETTRAAYDKAREAWTEAGKAVGAAPDDMDPAAKQKLVDAEKNALHAAQDALDKAAGAANRLLGDFKLFKPVNTSDKPHEEMAEYAKLLAPMAVGLVSKFQRDDRALASQAGAQRRNKDGLLEAA
jgi:hypothetical protein